MPVVFIDRDGVINENRDDYVKTVNEFIFLPGALEGLAKLEKAGITTVVVSNQAGIGRGLIEPIELERINEKMRQEIAEHGGRISALYYCTHRKDESCDCRKPEIGLFHKASTELDIELTGSFLIGDSKSDIEAGHRAGCKTILVLTGKTSAEDIGTWELRPDHIMPDLLTAADWILASL